MRVYASQSRSPPRSEKSRRRSPTAGLVMAIGSAIARRGLGRSMLAQEADDVVCRLGHHHPSLLERILLALRGAPVARDDCPRVAHALALRSRATRYESHRLQPAALCQQLGGALLVTPSDL